MRINFEIKHKLKARCQLQLEYGGTIPQFYRWKNNHFHATFKD
jgi:hypothetical protein